MIRPAVARFTTSWAASEIRGLPPGDHSVERRVDYINALIDWAADDAKQVYIRVTGAVGIAVFFLTQLPFEDLSDLSTPMRWILIGGIAALLISSVCYFSYVSATHLARRDLATCLLNADALSARGILVTVWQGWRWTFFVGNVLFGFGTLALGVVLAQLLHLP
jgi:hypothetical protein